MAKKRADDLDPLDRLFASLEDAAPGLHDLDPPSEELAPGLPPPLIELYARCDGARLFVDSLEIVASDSVVFDNGRWRFASVEGEDVAIDHRGRIWRADDSIDDDVCEGTRLDRWLAGEVDALGLLFDGDGEYAEDVFDEEGEITDVVRERQLRARLKRDAAAPGPRWRLAHSLIAQGATEDARNDLEQVVADDPAFAWA